MIKNRNIASDAKIDISKLNRVDGARTHYEDFDDDTLTDVANYYGLEKVLDGGTAVTSTSVNSCLEIKSNGGNRTALAAGSNQWSSDRGCKFSVRINDLDRDSKRINLMIGWVDVTGARHASAAGPGAAGSANAAYFMWDSNDSGVETSWQFRVINAAGTQTVNAGIPVSTTTSRVSVEFTSGGGVIAKINDTKVDAALNDIRTGRTDWVPFVRLVSEGGAAGSDSVIANIDTWAVEEDRS